MRVGRALEESNVRNEDETTVPIGRARCSHSYASCMDNAIVLPTGRVARKDDWALPNSTFFGETIFRLTPMQLRVCTRTR